MSSEACDVRVINTGVAGNTLYTANDVLAGDRIVNMNGNSLQFLSGGNNQWLLEPDAFGAGIPKLTFPGVVDPIGIIFDEVDGPTLFPTVAANKGVLYITDGSDGEPANNLIYKDENEALVNLSESLNLFTTDLTLAEPRTHDVNNQSFTFDNANDFQINAAADVAYYRQTQTNVNILAPTVSLISPTGDYIFGDGSAPTLPTTVTDASEVVLGIQTDGTLVRMTTGINNYANQNLTFSGNRVHTLGAFTITESADNTLGTTTDRIQTSQAHLLRVQSGSTFSLVSTSMISNHIGFFFSGGEQTGLVYQPTSTEIRHHELGVAEANRNAIYLDINDIDLRVGATSSLKIRGNAGTAGQSLKSQGGSLPPIWSGGEGNIVTATINSNIATTTFAHRANSTSTTTHNLPLASTVSQGHRLYVKRLGTGNVIVGRTGGNTIDGAAADFNFNTNTRSQFRAVAFASDGVSNWTALY